MRADGRNNKIVVVAFLPPLHRTRLHRTVETQVINCPSVYYGSLQQLHNLITVWVWHQMYIV